MDKTNSKQKLNKYLNMAMNLFLFNILFVVSNIVILGVTILVPMKLENMIFYLVALVFSIPSFVALQSSLYSYWKNRDIFPWSIYWHAYRMNFSQGMKYGIPALVTLFILLVDVYYFANHKNIFGIIFIGLLLFYVVSIIFYSILILCHFEVTSRNLLKLSIITIHKNIGKTIINMFTLFIVIFLMTEIPIISIFCLFSIFAMSNVYFNEDILVKLDKKYRN